jgi:hypothetical protein
MKLSPCEVSSNIPKSTCTYSLQLCLQQHYYDEINLASPFFFLSRTLFYRAQAKEKKNSVVYRTVTNKRNEARAANEE